MKLNKEDFLNSELGSNLLECIESWDWALRGGVKTKSSCRLVPGSMGSIPDHV